MSRPVLLVVDPSSEVTCQMADDVRANFRGIHVLTANTEEKGREIAERLRNDKRRLALLLVDLDCCRELAARVAKLHPSAKRALLTPFEERSKAVQAVSEGLAHYYLVKPWLPPKERLWPLIADLLDDWTAANEPKANPIRVYGHRWAPESHVLKDFLARNQAPYEWTDIDEGKDDATVQEVTRQGKALPAVILPDGTQLDNPSTSDLANRIGLKTEPDSKYYDLVIVGGGPAGLAASVYAASEGLKTLVVEKEAPGGQAGCSSLIENYLGFPQGLSGSDLARRATDQALKFNVEILTPQVAVGLRKTNGYRTLRLEDGKEVHARTILLSMGVSYRRLQCPGEERLFGKGVYYGATYAEAVECKDEQICIVGCGNSAGQAAMHFAQYASKVTLIARESDPREVMSDYLLDRIESLPNVEILTNSCVDELEGEDRLEAVIVGQTRIPCNSIFVFIGADPHTDWLPPEVLRDRDGYLLTGGQILRTASYKWPLKRTPLHLETSMPGVFAAGDVRAGSTKRIASAVGQGAAAVQLVHEYLREIHA